MNIALKYWPDENNAGDVFSRHVAERFIGPVTSQATGDPFGSTNVMLIGSLLQWCDSDTVVCGSGLISPDMLPIAIPKKVIAVRGPHTRCELLKIGCSVPERYGDPGLLANEFATTEVKETHKYGVLLHYAHKRWLGKFGRGWIRKRDDTLYINVQQEPLKVFDEIQRCGTIISSSLHGIVFAHALSKKVAWVQYPGLVGGLYKFHDYFASVGLAPDAVHPLIVTGVADLRDIADQAIGVDVAKMQAVVKENLAQTRQFLEDVGAVKSDGF